MLPVISIVGFSKSGKTTLVEGLIAELARRGRRVAAVKHTKDDFDMDRPGKDTWRFGEAGCGSIAILAPERYALLKRRERDYSSDEVLHLAGADTDVVLLEGLHTGPAPKIEVHRAELGRELRCKPEDLLAVVTDEPLDVDCRQFSPRDVSAVADLIEEEIAATAGDGATLLVNGAPVSLGRFTQGILSNTVLGLISSFKGVGEIKTVSVSIRRGSKKQGNS